MLRDKNLVPLSRQHQHALALCVRIDRASPIPESDLAAWQGKSRNIFAPRSRVHFTAEEQFVFPRARTFAELNSLVDELLSEHVWLRERFARAEAESMSAAEVVEFAQRLSAHIRKRRAAGVRTIAGSDERRRTPRGWDKDWTKRSRTPSRLALYLRRKSAVLPVSSPRVCVVAILTPLRGSVIFHLATHSSRCGLYSCAASRL